MPNMRRANYISVQDFIDYNPELDLSNYTATTISGMITRASAQADNFLNYTLSIESITQEKSEILVNSKGNLIIYTRKMPIQSVEAIRLVQGTVSINLNLQNSAGVNRFDIPARAAYIQYPYAEVTTTGTVSIRNFLDARGQDVFVSTDYTAGYSDIPTDIKDAVNLMVKDIFIRQSNPLNLASVNQGGIAMRFKDPRNERGKSDLILAAEGLLAQYKRVVEI